MPLPIDAILDSLCIAIQSNHPVVLKAPPGAGKTTGVPPAILSQCDGDRGIDGKQIWVIQPRRLAARSVATWLADRHGETVGQTYGYHVRLNRQESAATRVVSMTTGMFLRRMQSDPFLENVGCVVLDEFHERTLDLDVALALTTRLRTSFRSDLRIVVMSATLETQPIAEYLDAQREDGSPTAICLTSEGRSFPVEIHFQPGSMNDRLENRVADGVRFALQQTAGHVLVFLPGVGEIERTRRWLEQSDWILQPDRQTESITIHPLHGSLSSKDQDAAIQSTKKRSENDKRRIILATNIAETSVTVDGVTAVVDSGLAKTSVMDSRLGLSRLQVTPISQASADQRAGRAGRTGPGIGVRLWSKTAMAARPAYDSPEIQRNDLSGVVLMLAEMGETELSEIGWLTPPPSHSVAAATVLLNQLGAIDADGKITAAGRAMSALPLHPRLAKFGIEASPHFDPNDVAIASALLSERDPFDDRDLLSLSEKVRMVKQSSIRGGRVETVRSVARQIARTLKGMNLPARIQTDTPPTPKRKSDDENWTRSLLAAYPDRVVLRRSEDPDRGRMVGGRGVSGMRRFDTTATSPPLMLCYDVDGGGTESRVRAAVALDEEWLDSDALVDQVEVEFDSTSESIRGRRVRRYLDLVLKETPASVEPDERTQACLFEAAIAALEPLDQFFGDEVVSHIMQRIELVGIAKQAAESDPQSQAPLSSQEQMRSVLMDLCSGRVSFAQLRKAPWKDYLIGQIGYDQWRVVEREAPTHLVLPSGNRALVHYVRGKSPWVEAKIQECFGWASTPRILFGRVPVQMHLLGPNRRAQQITDDLSSFWANTYTEIRKELRRRYPKHYWPEDPTTATATHNGLKPRP